MEHCLLEKRDDGIAVITMNRPDQLNAVDDPMQELLEKFLIDCEQDESVRCVALTGAGRGFCAGGDVKGQNDSSGKPVKRTLEERAAGLQRGHMAISHKLHTMAKPTVALVNGPAAGAGLSLALACDLRVCSDKARFHTSFSKVGLSGDYGGTYFLQHLIGYGRAIELYYFSDPVDAAMALDLGIANKVVPHDQFMDECMSYCLRLAQGPTVAYANIKANFNASETATAEEGLAQESRTMTASGGTADHAEGARAFVERRPPKFKGR